VVAQILVERAQDIDPLEIIRNNGTNTLALSFLSRSLKPTAGGSFSTKPQPPPVPPKPVVNSNTASFVGSKTFVLACFPIN